MTHTEQHILGLQFTTVRSVSPPREYALLFTTYNIEVINMLRTYIVCTYICYTTSYSKYYLYFYFLHFGAFSRCFYPKRLAIITFLRRRRNNHILYCCRYSKDVHRTKCQALTIVRFTHSPYTTKIARIRCHTIILLLLSTIFKCEDWSLESFVDYIIIECHQMSERAEAGWLS